MDSLKLIYNPQANEFMAWGMKYADTTQVGGGTGADWEDQTLVSLRLSTAGEALSQPTKVISDTTLTTLPALAYSPQSNRYLLAWGVGLVGNKGLVTRSNIIVRGLAADLALGERQVLSSADGYWPTVAHNGDDDEFLVAWYDAAGFPVQFPPPVGTATPTPSPTPVPTGAPTPEPSTMVKGIYAQRLRGDGALVEGAGLLPLAALDLAPQDVRGLRLTYNRHAHEYLLVWAQGGPYPGLYSRRLSRAGAPIGDAVRLTTTSATPYYPMLAYNDTDHQYLLVWSDAEGGAARYSDVYGLVLTEAGTAQGVAFPIRATAKYERPTEVVYNPVLREYLVAWDTYEGSEIRDTQAKTTLQRVTVNGALLGEPVETLGGVFSVGVNPNTGAYLVLERFGFQPRIIGDGPVCVPTEAPTPTATPTGLQWWFGPTPTPYVVQRKGEIVLITKPAYGEKWLIRREGSQGIEIVVVTQQTRIDDTIGRPDVGAEAWFTTHEQITAVDQRGPWIEHISEHIAVLAPADTATPTPTGTATPTATATATSTPTPTATGQALGTHLFLPYLVVKQVAP